MDNGVPKQPLQKGSGIGQVFEDRYVLLEQLGAGGFSTVFKAQQTDVGRYVAVKIYHPHVREDESFTERFLLEAQVLNKLSHENIVAIYHIGLSTEQIPYMVMEMLGPKSLRRWIHSFEKGPPPTLPALRIIRDVANALAFVHKQGVIHRDLKPDNIVLEDKPEPLTVKLIDFGLARDSQRENQKLTQTGEILGTAQYMSPEQCSGKNVIDYRSDIYSLGICLFEILTGQKPFGNDTAIGIMYKHMNEELPYITSSEVQLYSETLNAILSKSTQKNPANRYQSMEEFAGAIEEALVKLEKSGSSVFSSCISRLKSSVPQTGIIVAVFVIGAGFLGFNIYASVKTSGSRKNELLIVGRTDLQSKARLLQKDISDYIKSPDFAIRHGDREKALMLRIDDLIAQSKLQKDNLMTFVSLQMKSRFTDQDDPIRLAALEEATKYIVQRIDGDHHRDYLDTAVVYLDLAQYYSLFLNVKTEEEKREQEKKIRDAASKVLKICSDPRTVPIGVKNRDYSGSGPRLDRITAEAKILLAESFLRGRDYEQASAFASQVVNSMTRVDELGSRASATLAQIYLDKGDRLKAKVVMGDLQKSFKKKFPEYTGPELDFFVTWYKQHGFDAEAKEALLSKVKKLQADEANKDEKDLKPNIDLSVEGTKNR